MTQPASPTVSFVVPCYNSRRYLDTCFAAIERSTYTPIEVIAVDDGSTDGTAEYLTTHFPNVTLLRQRRNRGFAPTANVGLRRARGELVALLNVDTEIPNSWLEQMVADFTSDPSIGILGCRMLDEDGTVRHDGATISPIGLTDHWVHPKPPEAPFDVPYACGAGWLSGQGLMYRLTFFDEGFAPMYFEDADFCLRVRQAGWRVCSTAATAMLHFEANDTGRTTPRYLRRYHASRVRYNLKNRPLLDLLARYPAEEARYFLTGHGKWLRQILLFAYIKNLMKLPLTLRARRRKKVE